MSEDLSVENHNEPCNSVSTHVIADNASNKSVFSSQSK